MANARAQKNRAVDRLRAFVKKFRAVPLNTARAVDDRKQMSQDKKRKDSETRRSYDELREAKRAFVDEYQKAHGGRMPKKKDMQAHCKKYNQLDFSEADNFNYHERGGQVGENQKVVDPRAKLQRDMREWREAVPSHKPT